jgi:hypothetical protein
MTWQHVGQTTQETVVFGTQKWVYAMYGWGIPDNTNFEVTPQPGMGNWTQPATPAAMTMGPAQAAVTNDGMHNILVLANYLGGVWRYIEP